MRELKPRRKEQQWRNNKLGSTVCYHIHYRKKQSEQITEFPLGSLMSLGAISNYHPSNLSMYDCKPKKTQFLWQAPPWPLGPLVVPFGFLQVFFLAATKDLRSRTCRACGSLLGNHWSSLFAKCKANNSVDKISNLSGVPKRLTRCGAANWRRKQKRGK